MLVSLGENRKRTLVSHTRIKHSVHQPGPSSGKFSVISDSLRNHGQQALLLTTIGYTRGGGAVTDVAVVEGLHSLAVFLPYLQRVNVGTSSHFSLRHGLP